MGAGVGEIDGAKEVAASVLTKRQTNSKARATNKEKKDFIFFYFDRHGQTIVVSVQSNSPFFLVRNCYEVLKAAL